MTEFTPSGVLARAAAHFDALRGQSIEVPEWGTPDAPLAVYFDPLTAADAQAIQRRGNGNQARIAALAVILHARDADGAPMFEDTGPVLEYFMKKLDPVVWLRVSRAITGDAARPGADALGE